MAGPAYEMNWGTDITLPTDFDMTGDQFLFVTLGSDGYINVASTGQLAIGVCQDSPVGTPTAPIGVPVRTMAPTKIQGGGTFVAGDLLASNSVGKAVKYTGASVYTGTPYTVSGSQVLGIALNSGASGSDSAMLFRPSGLSA